MPLRHPGVADGSLPADESVDGLKMLRQLHDNPSADVVPIVSEGQRQ